MRIRTVPLASPAPSLRRRTRAVAPILPSLLLTCLALPAPRATLEAQSFGGAVLVIDGMVVAGEPTHQRKPGAVRAFAPEEGAWRELWTLHAPDAAVGDEFGRSLAHAGEMLLVGGGNPADDESAGVVYAYRLDALAEGEMEPFQMLTAGGGMATFGSKLLASERELAAMAMREDESRVLLFWRLGEDGLWAQGEILPLPEGTGDFAAMGGDLLAVADPGERMAHIFERAEDGSWGAATALTAPGGGSAGRALFGASVAVADDEVLVGQIGLDPEGRAVHRFAKEGGAWGAVGMLTPDADAGGNFGAMLAFDGTTLFVGGDARVSSFVREAGDWAAVGASGIGAAYGGGIRIGSRPPVFGNGIAAVGDPGADFGMGAVTVLMHDGDAWRRTARLIVDHDPLPAIRGGEVLCDEGGAAGYDCDHVDLIAFIPREELGAGRGARLNDVWGWTDAETGREYALVGRMDGTAFVDVTDAANPRYLGNLPMTEGSRANTWRDVKVYRDHAFVVADGAGQHGMQIFDLTQLRDVGEPREFEATAMYNEIASSHNIAINEETGFAYLVGSSDGGVTCGGGSHIVDINDPVNPAFAGCFAHEGTGRRNTGNSHDTQCVIYHGPDERYSGREICINSNETALSVADVTDKDNPVAISAADYPNVAYAHQGWLTEDHRYFYSNDELDEVGGLVSATRTLIWDLEDLDDPLLISEYMNPTRATDHNLYVRGDRLYMSNNRAGLRILDISDPENPVEAGHFDTTPWGPDEAGFDGTWSVYPYFASGTVLLSSRREGLFIVRPRLRNLVP